MFVFTRMQAGRRHGTTCVAPTHGTDLRESATVWRLGAAKPHARGAKAAPAGTSLRFVASAAALVTYAFARLAGGRSVAGSCVARTPANRSRPRCTRRVPDGAISLDATAGPNRDRFDGRLGGERRLAPGRYLVTVTAQAIGGAAAGASAGTAGTLRFGIVK